MKAPGVSGSKISSITQLCNANIQSESVLIQKIYTHFKKAPGTHKLGVLYVVDSVTRSWVEQARKAGQQPSPSAAYGTYGAGVYRVTELLPMLMTDITNTAPEDQKARIKKLVDIWERGNTFPNDMLTTFKEKLDTPANGKTLQASKDGIMRTIALLKTWLLIRLFLSVGVKSTTPPGSPPKDFISLTAGQDASAKNAGNANGAPAADTSAILKALADMAKSNTGAVQASTVANIQNTYPQTMPTSVNQAPSIPPISQAVAVPGVNGAPQFAAMSNTPVNFPLHQPSGQANMQVPPVMPPQANGAPAMTPEIQQQLQILQALQAQGVPQEQWANVLSVVMASGAGAAAPNVHAAPQQGWQPNGGGYGDQSRDLHSFRNQSVQSPSGHFRGPRSRSRSPSTWDRRGNGTPPRRRDSPVYGEYGRDARNNDRGGYGRSQRGRGDGYRQRSPNRNRRSPSPRRSGNELGPPGPKFVEYDSSLRPGMIKVLSRTLFVGGVTCSEAELRDIFSAYGVVQTCIVNVDKRHAFVKMVSRKDAEQARDGMERYKSSDMQLRTKWGVGFGPRDCSDYSTGISIVPITRLTDADRKWMLTAEYGGSGGKAIETGMVVEEPDIEIGAGVSSKAISRRMATDRGGYSGPRSSRDGAINPNNIPASNSRFPQFDRDSSTPNNTAVAVPPAIPSFGFQFPTLPNGMPIFPPGMMPPGPNQAGQQPGSS
ncbi:MAG: hypothetical protein L6R39_002760 [Caloplaca ligustica]|nr:MAG: hypothetical protein L6R39_002760 [Caloplaca ligustica]